MSELFISVYLDEDVNVLVAELIRSQNFKALTVTEAGKRGNSDAKQLEFATAKGYAILTHNRTDFEKLAQKYFAENRTHSGIISAVRRPPHEITERLLEVLNKFTADEMINQIIYI